MSASLIASRKEYGLLFDSNWFSNLIYKLTIVFLKGQDEEFDSHDEIQHETIYYTMCELP